MSCTRLPLTPRLPSSTNTGQQSSPLIGTMAAYPFLVNPNVPPIIIEGASTSVSMSKNSAPFPFSLTLHASDPNGDLLTWSIAGAAAHGTATAGGTGASVAVAYTPNPDYVGTDSFIVQVDDGFGGSAGITVNVTIEQSYKITITKPGTGTGTVTVNSPLGVISCGATCSADFPVGQTLVLSQTPDTDSGFSGWGGGTCSGTGVCAFSMSSDKYVTADFTLSPPVKNQTTGVAYSLLQTACSDALDNHTIVALSTLPAAGLVLDKAVSITINGGYDAVYSSRTGLTPVTGPLNNTTRPATSERPGNQTVKNLGMGLSPARSGRHLASLPGGNLKLSPR